MIDLATLFQEASTQHAAETPTFPTSDKGKSEEQDTDGKRFSVISDVSDSKKGDLDEPEFEEPQARAHGRASERARDAYVDRSEMSELSEKTVPAGGCLSDYPSQKSEKRREVGKAEPLPAPPAGPEPPTFDERAAFLEYECGLSRAEAEAQARAETTIIPSGKNAPAATTDGLAVWRAGLARLDYETAPCPGYRSDEWRNTLARAVAFLDQFGAQAEALGWTAGRLFGVHETAGIVRVDACGALVLPIGGPVRAITATEIRFGHLTHRQKPGQPAGVSWWEWRR